jgi:hypothetical protein
LFQREGFFFCSFVIAASAIGRWAIAQQMLKDGNPEPQSEDLAPPITALDHRCCGDDTRISGLRLERLFQMEIVT